MIARRSGSAGEVALFRARLGSREETQEYAFSTTTNCSELHPAETGRYAHRTHTLIASAVVGGGAGVIWGKIRDKGFKDEDLMP